MGLSEEFVISVLVSQGILLAKSSTSVFKSSMLPFKVPIWPRSKTQKKSPKKIQKKYKTRYKFKKDQIKTYIKT